MNKTKQGLHRVRFGLKKLALLAAPIAVILGLQLALTGTADACGGEENVEADGSVINCL